MALTNILREFLVRIGYETDEASRQKFMKGLAGATEVVLGLGAAIEATAVAVVAGIEKMSSSMERFYFMSQRTGAAVAGIKALGYAADQMGISAEAAYSTLESIASFMRSSPQAAALLKNMGVDTNGKDTAQIMVGIGQAFARMPVYMANAYARVLGIDERTMLAMRQGMAQYANDYADVLKRVGVDEQKAAAGAHSFMVQIRKTEAELKVFSDYVVQLVSERAGKYVEQFRVFFERNFTRIADVLANTIKWTLLAADVFVRLGLRAGEILEGLYEKFRKLPDIVQDVLLAVTALWAAFQLANPTTLLITGLAIALLGLYDDYKTWREGGKHLIDWAAWIREMDTVKAYMKGWWDYIVKLWDTNFLGLRTYFKSLALFPAIIINHWAVLKGFFKDLWGYIDDVFLSSFSAVIDPAIAKMKGFVSWLSNTWVGKKLLSLSAGPSADTESFVDREFDNAYGGGSSGAGGAGNVGNIRKPGSAEFEHYDSPEQGLKAMRDLLLRRYAAKGLDTIRKIIEVYAPRKSRGGDNPDANVDAYESHVAEWTGIGDIDKKIDLKDARTMARMLLAMTRQEGHPQNVDLVARVAGLSGGGVNIQQSNVYNINGATNPQATAAAVGAAQTTSNQKLTRNLKPVAQ